MTSIHITANPWGPSSLGDLMNNQGSPGGRGDTHFTGGAAQLLALLPLSPYPGWLCGPYN